MPVAIEPNAPVRLSDADLRPRKAGTVHPSPQDWRDQILYFLLPDRFANGNENNVPRFDCSNPGQHHAGDVAAWMAAGKKFQGGKIQGITAQLPYLKGLGVTTLWVGPVWKQRAGFDDYHGYAIQNFLEVDPRFGTRQDLRDLVDAAHALEMYVLLDVVYNHSGNNWFYRGENGKPVNDMPYRFSPPYPVHGWRTATGASVPVPASPEDGVWPQEFQDFGWYTRAGKIGNFDPIGSERLNDPNAEFRRGDFESLRDLRLNEKEDPPTPQVLAALVDVYRYWIALTDCDGFRIDTCKHIQEEASRNFCGGIREYAESIGKQNFLLLGEVAGGAAMEREYIFIFGRNLDAALDLGEPPKRLAELAKGQGDSVKGFFSQFEGHDAIGSHRQIGRYHVSVLDDHDMIGRAHQRFSALNGIPAAHLQVAHAVGIQLTTLGIPCIYYGTEQAFNGGEYQHDTHVEPLDGGGKIPYADRYIRECMFGGTFGAFQTSGCHFFDPEHPTYLRIAAISAVVRRSGKVGLALRRGRQYLRDVRVLGPGFGEPRAGEVVAWSRLLYDCEVLIAVNTHGTDPRGADVTVDAQLHPVGTQMSVLYRGDWSDAELKHPPTTETVEVRGNGTGRAFVRIDLPPAGMMILG